MVIVRPGKSEKLLQKMVQGRCCLDVLASHDMGDALEGIIRHHRDVIA